MHCLASSWFAALIFVRAAVDSVDDRSPYWRRERISFDVACGDERVIAHRFLPENAAPPSTARFTLFVGADSLYLHRPVERVRGDPM